MNSTAKRRPELPVIIPGAEPFESASQAWFWACSALAAAREGANRPSDLSTMPRACEPHDVFLLVKRLHLVRRLTDAHLRVLGRYGRECIEPELSPCHITWEGRLWLDAMEALEPPLRAKELLVSSHRPANDFSMETRG